MDNQCPAKVSNELPSESAVLLDLELQWKDHHHMRDQTWKVMASNVVLLGGVIALGAKTPEPAPPVMIAAHILVVLASIFGWAISDHHRSRQKQKFAMIKAYEKRLGLYDLKAKIVEGDYDRKGISAKIFTGNFLGWVQIGVAILATMLLITKIP